MSDGRVLVMRAGRVVSDTAGELAAPPEGYRQPPRLAGSEARTAEGYPSMVRQAASFGASMLKWFAAGAPTRTAEEIDALAVICRDCPSGLFDAEQERCRACGCPAKGAGSLRNKLALRTESCPRGHWPTG